MFSREKGYEIRAKVHGKGGENDPNWLPVSHPTLCCYECEDIIMIECQGSTV